MSDYEDIMDLLGPSVTPFEPSSREVSRPAPPTVQDTTSEANVWLPTSVAAHYKEYDRFGPAVDELEALIARDGLLTPIRISTDGREAVVHEGNHRLQVAERLGIPEVPAIVTFDSPVFSNGGRVTPLEPVLGSWVEQNRGRLRSFWGHRTASSDIVVRGLKYDEVSFELGQKFMNGTMTARDIIEDIEKTYGSVGVWWGTVGSSADDFYGSPEDARDYAGWAGDGSIEHRWQDMLSLTGGVPDPSEWIDAEIRLVLVAKKPMRDYGLWNPTTENGNGSAWESTSFFAEGERLELVQVQYAADYYGRDWKVENVSGLTVTAGTEFTPGPVYRGLNVSVLDYDEQQELAEWANANAFSLYDYQLAEPNYELVYKVLDRLDPRGLGRHWSKDYDVAADFARDQGDGIQLILIGDWDGNGLDTREFHRGYDDVLRPSNLEHEKEVTLLPGSRITLVGMDVVNEDGFTHNIPVPNLMVTAGRTAGDYFMQHRPAGPDYGGQMHDVSDFFPDIETLPTRMYDFGEPGSQGSIRQIIDAQGNPNKSVTIYRAVPKGADPIIRNGDWVTISREYAEQHGMSNVDGVYDILSATVQAQDIWTDGNSVNEFGYWGPELRTARTYTASVEDGSEYLRTPGAKIDWTPAEAPFDGIWFGYNGRDQTFASYYHAGKYDEEDYLLSKAWSDDRIAKLQWTPSGEVAIIWTKMDYRRIGLATALFNWTKANIFPGLQHSNDMTSSGYEWAKSMGHDPEDWELMRALPHYAASAGKLYRGVRIDLGVDLSLAQPGSSIETVGQELQLGPLVLDALSRQGGLGTHWSTRPEIAERFALESSGNGGGTPVLVTVDWDGSGEDLERTDTGGTWTDEAEVTLLPGTPITVTSVKLGSSFSDGVEVLHSDRYLGYASDFAAAGLPVPQGGPQQRTASPFPYHDTYTQPFLPGHDWPIYLYRGMALTLPSDLENELDLAVVDWDQNRIHQVGDSILDMIGNIGRHWTTEPDVAVDFAQMNRSAGNLIIVISAVWERKGEDFAEEHVGWDGESRPSNVAGEFEVTLTPGTQVRLLSVKARRVVNGQTIERDWDIELLRSPQVRTAEWQPWHSDDQEEAQEIAHGTTIYRGMKVVLSDADLEQIRRWQQIPLVEEERGQHFNIGPFLLERLEPLGIHWTTKRRIAEISAMQGGGYGGSGIIIEAEYNGGQDLRGTAYHTTDWSSEEEITMLPGAQVRITGVFLTGIDERKNLLREPRLITAKEER